MTIPKLTLYTGEVANPDGSQTQSEFTQNMFNQLSYESQLATQLNNTVDGMNGAVDEVESNSVSAENSANAAEAAAASAGYQGLWPDTGGSALKGEVWQTQVGGTPTGEYYTALQNTSLNPVGDNVNWKVQNDLNTGNLSDYTDLVYKESGGNSAVENMISGIPIAAKVGDKCSTGGTSWRIVGPSSSRGVITDSGNRAIPLNGLWADDFGCEADGIADDTDSLKAALQVDGVLNLSRDGVYAIRSEANTLLLSEGQVINFNGATVKGLPTDLDSYHLFVVEEVKATLNGPGVIKGDRDEHTGTTGEQGFCVAVRGGSLTLGDGMELRDSWGDNLYIGRGPTKAYSSNIVCNGTVKLINARRNDLSIVSVDGFKADILVVSDANGTPPEFGIDFEPNNSDERLSNIVIDVLETSGNANAAIGFAIDKLAGGGNPVSITINSLKDVGSLFALKFNLSLNTKGYIKIKNVIADSQVKNAITFANWQLTAPQVDIDGIHTIVNHSRTADIIGDTPISFQMPNGEVGGNVNIKNAEQSFTDTNTGTGYNVAFQSPQTFRSVSLENIEGQILNQHRLGGGSKIVDDEFFGQGGNFTFPFTDKKYINLKNVPNNGNQQVTLQAFQDSDTVYELTNVSDSGSDALAINPPSGESLYPLGIDDSNSGKLFLDSLGKTIKMRRQNGRWVILGKNY